MNVGENIRCNIAPIIIILVDINISGIIKFSYLFFNS